VQLRPPAASARAPPTRPDAERPLLGERLFGDDPTRIGNGVHHGVTDRWLPFYACSIAGWHNDRTDDRCSRQATLAGALATPVHPFARLRPRAPPNRTLTSWNQGDRPMEVLRSWGCLQIPGADPDAGRS
jgi:hypothetical protein